MIDAWLENGEPRLRIVDADSGAVRLDWSCAAGDGAAPCDHDRCPARAALHGLINDLFLLACADCIRSGRPAGAGRAAPAVPAHAGHAPLSGHPAKKITATAA